MLKINRYKYSPAAVVFFTIIGIFILSLLLKSKIIDLISFPLKISSNWTSDIRALVAYKFIADENVRLNAQLAGAANDAIAFDELRQENERLKKLLSLKKESSFVTVAAEVIARDPNNWSTGVIIDKGQRQGIKAGNAVIASEGLSGRIVDVYSYTAKIMLLGDADSSVSAIIQRTREEGLISGTIAGAVQMRYLSKDSDVVIGDVIMTSGLTRNYPAGLPIGRVIEVKDDPQGLGKHCLVRPFVNLRTVEEVLVITGSKY